MFCAEGFTSQAMLPEILGTDDWISYDPIIEGNSAEQKYRIKDADDQLYLLHLSEKTQYERKKNEFTLLERLHLNNVPVPCPVQYGLSKSGDAAYLLRKWVSGQTLNDSLERMDPVRQYALGHEAGLYVALLHKIQSVKHAKNWFDSIEKECGKAIKMLDDQDIRLVCIRKLIRFLADNLHCLRNRPQTQIHARINLENIILTQERTLCLIGFDRCCSGDPLYDVASVMAHTSQVSQRFTTGFLDCYFYYQMRTKASRIIACYVALQSLQQFSFNSKQSPSKRREALRHVQQIVQDYRNMTQVVPAWYEELPDMKSEIIACNTLE